MTKPKYLYHASPASNLRVIKPRSLTVPSNFGHGPVVFATQSFAFATQFLVPHDDSWANGGAFDNTYFFVISDRRRFEKVDRGGAIYLVSSKDFERYNKREWYSSGSVKPAGKAIFSSGLMAMITHNIQVYFVRPKVFQEIQKSPDNSLSLLDTLKPENQKWGRKVVKMDIYKGSKKAILIP